MANDMFKKNLNESGIERLAKELQFDKESIPPPPTPSPKPPPQPKVDIKKELHKEVDETAIKPLRTYAGDMQEAIEKQHESVVSVQLKEQQRYAKEERQKQTSVKQKASWTAISFISLFLIISGLVIVGVIWLQTKEKHPEPVVNSFEGIITPDERIRLGTNNFSIEQVRAVFANELAKTTPKDFILDFELTRTNLVTKEEQRLGITEFLIFIKSQTPTQFTRSLEDKYLLGVYRLGDTSAPFLILKTTDYDSGFAGMLEWERKALEVLPNLWGGEIVISEEPFVDVVIRNRDARTDKTRSLFYSFLDSNTILITNNQTAIGEILTRYIASQVTR